MKAYAFVANGTEESELLCVADLLRRAEIETVIVSIESNREIISSHNVKLSADAKFDEVDFIDADLIFIPGGLPGSQRLSDFAPLNGLIAKCLSNGKRVAAICAAPALVLGRHGFLNGKRATCAPGFEAELKGAAYIEEAVVTDGLITTARGLGAALDLGLEIITLTKGEAAAKEMRAKIQYFK